MNSENKDNPDNPKKARTPEHIKRWIGDRGKLIYYYIVGVVCRWSGSVSTIIAGKYLT